MTDDVDAGGSDPFGLRHLGRLSRPIEKLIETVGAGTGTWFEPHRIRRRAQAEADATRTLARARADELDIAYRARLLLEDRELRRQRNRESIIRLAAAALPERVDDASVDPDWTAAFFNSCEDVGSERMQSLWAKLLGGEVAKPGTYSLRTLHFVRTLSAKDAEIFTRFSGFVWTIEGGPDFVFNWPVCHTWMDQAGIPMLSVQHLVSIGLLADQTKLSLFKADPVPTYSYFGRIFHVRLTAHAMNFPIRALTEVGSELLPICGAQEVSGIVDEVRGIMFGQGETLLSCADPRSTDAECRAEWLAEQHDYEARRCGTCDRKVMINENGRMRCVTAVEGQTPCPACGGTGRFWFRGGHVEERGLTDSELLGCVSIAP